MSSGRVFATSVDVADFFDKRHDHVLRDIDTLFSNAAELSPSFEEIEGRVQVGFGKRRSRVYEMDRNGFAFLAMGFPGPKALSFKSRYIDAFDEALSRFQKIEAKSLDLIIPVTFAEALSLAAADVERREKVE